MSLLRTRGQYLCFSAGTWIGSIVAGVCELMLRSPSPSPRELPFLLLLILYIPFSFLLGSLYAGWHVLRTKICGRSATIHWMVPLSVGIAYFPLLFGAIPLLIRTTGQGQGVVIGSCIAMLIFGLPILAAEVSVRFAKDASAPGRS